VWQKGAQHRPNCGRANDSFVHFEVRTGLDSVDPTPYLKLAEIFCVMFGTGGPLQKGPQLT